MESLLIFGVIIAVIILCVVIKSINNKRFEKTKELSVLYKSILSLNKEYKFYSDVSDLNFNPALKSKRSLDKFDLTQYVAEKLNENRSFYKSLFQHAEQNAKDYNEYCAKYLRRYGHFGRRVRSKNRRKHYTREYYGCDYIFGSDSSWNYIYGKYLPDI